MEDDIKKKMDRVYDQHTKRNDGRCQGYHESGNYVNEVYNHILERDFIDELCEEQDEM